MSRAFVNESAAEGAVEPLPDKPIPPHRNFVTAEGLAQIEATVAALQAEIADATRLDRAEALPSLARDLKYWMQRRVSAELVPAGDADEVRFGATVTIARAGGDQQRFRIVGEDEADPARGTLSYVAPLARALMGKGEGDEVVFRGETIEILAIA